MFRPSFRLVRTAVFLHWTLLMGPWSFAAQPHSPSQPNILLITVDDLNHWVQHLARNTQAITPNIDRLAARGTTFTRAYTASPVCNPSRTAFLTGMRPSTTGVYGNSTSWRSVIPDGYTLPGWLKSHGYQTYGMGKLFHTSRQIRDTDWTAYPQDLKDGSIDQISESSTNTSTTDAKDPSIRYVAGDLSIAELNTDDTAQGDHATVSAAIDTLANQTGEAPFLIACGIFRPHLPWHVPAKYFEMYPEDQIKLPPYRADDLDDIPHAKPKPEHLDIVRDGMWRKAVRAYLACMTYADTEVGRLLDALEASPYRDNTIVILLGDHGWYLGEKSQWRKTLLWEEAQRMPYIWAGPGIKPGGRSDRVVDLMSLFPTLTELTQIKTPDHLDGVSIAPLLKDPLATWDGPPAVGTWHFNNHTVRTDRFRYLRWDNGDEELYDHDHDPYEWYNLLHASNVDRTKGIDIAAVVAEHRAYFPTINRTEEEGQAYFAHRVPPTP